ncbi:MAG: hypothetical protein RXO22_09850 [Thermocladium sp.]|jgi:translin
MELSDIIRSIETRISVVDETRERLLKDTRDIIRTSKEVILRVAKGDLNAESNNVNKIMNQVMNVINIAKNVPEVYYSGILDGPLAEYAEAMILYNLVKQNKYPTPEELGIYDVPYLLGLGDVVGELRRIVLDKLRLEKYKEAEALFNRMEEIYEVLSTLIIPNALAPGLRPKVDVARKLVDATRSDLFLAQVKRGFINDEDNEENKRELH